MISISDALALVLSHAGPLPVQHVALEDALGLTLAEDIAADVDSPPHDKSMVDGYAVAEHFSEPMELAVIEEVTAGDVPKLPLLPGQATRIMTGAPVPKGAVAVVMVERTETPAAGRVRIVEGPAKTGQNIMQRAASLRAGDVVLAAGHPLRYIEIGLLAEVGRAIVPVHRRPTVAILSTGNELVPPDRRPAAGQIRNSNGPMLAAAVTRCGASARELGIARDERPALQAAIQAGLECDVLLLSGGISAGVLDLVPSVLREAGVREVFHKIRLKPGKPTWFGVAGGTPTKLVFGLVGNPVGSLVGFELFVRPALRRLAGLPEPASSPLLTASLTAPFQHRGDRPTYHPGVLSAADQSAGQVPTVTPLPWKGSADLRTLVDANCLILFPAGDQAYAAGDPIGVRPLES